MGDIADKLKDANAFLGAGDDVEWARHQDEMAQPMASAADAFLSAAAEPKAPPKPEDPMRPNARRGRYSLPDPKTGKPKSWQRMTNLVKNADDTYHLVLWEKRNIAKGLATMFADPAEYGFHPMDVHEALAHVARLDVKGNKERLNSIVTVAMDVADAYEMAEEGTKLHESTELVDGAHGDLNVAPLHHQVKMALYLTALREAGLEVVPELIERVTVSETYQAAGKFDRIYRMVDGSYVLGDLKTSDSDLSLSMPSIAAQLDGYRDGINNVGIFDGQRYDRSIRVRDDIALVIHLPSTRHECHVIEVDLEAGRQINAVNVAVREIRRVKAASISRIFQAARYQRSQDEMDQYWLVQLNGAHSRDELIALAGQARKAGEWNERLAGQARLLAAGFEQMGS